MFFADSKIIKELLKGNINITPFSIEQLNSNSYDFRLGDVISIYSKDSISEADATRLKLNEIDDFVNLPDTASSVTIDTRSKTDTFTFTFDEITIMANRLVLMTTKEVIGTKVHHISLHAKSSTGRSGLQVCGDAGWGDTGFDTHWTLEVVGKFNTKLYKDMKIGQAVFSKTDGHVLQPYNGRYTSDNQASAAKIEKARDTIKYLHAYTK